MIQERVQAGADAALVDAVVEKLFTTCVVAPLLADMA